MSGFPGRVCPDRNSFLVPRMERDFGLHTTTERRSLKTPGLRVRFQFQNILSPAGRWSYSRRPFSSSSGSSALYSSLICTLWNLTTPEPYWSANDPPKCLLSCTSAVFFTVQHDNKMRTLRRDFIDIPFAGGLRYRIDLLRVLHRGNETG